VHLFQCLRLPNEDKLPDDIDLWSGDATARVHRGSDERAGVRVMARAHCYSRRATIDIWR
jgi:hypothetical protein